MLDEKMKDKDYIQEMELYYKIGSEYKIYYDNILTEIRNLSDSQIQHHLYMYGFVLTALPCKLLAQNDILKHYYINGRRIEKIFKIKERLLK